MIINALEQRVVELEVQQLQAVKHWIEMVEEHGLSFADVAPPVQDTMSCREFHEQEETDDVAAAFLSQDAGWAKLLESLPPDIRAAAGKMIETCRLLAGARTKLMAPFLARGIPPREIAERIEARLQQVREALGKPQ